MSEQLHPWQMNPGTPEEPRCERYNCDELAVGWSEENLYDGLKGVCSTHREELVTKGVKVHPLEMAYPVYDSREVYNDSFDGGYGAGSYFSWAMNKDD